MVDRRIRQTFIPWGSYVEDRRGKVGCLSPVQDMCVPQAYDFGRGTINQLQLLRFCLCILSPRMNSSHAMKTCVLILLVALLCAERGELGKGLRVGGTPCIFTVCPVPEVCWGQGMPSVDWCVMGELSWSGVASWACKPARTCLAAFPSCK